MKTSLKFLMGCMIVLGFASCETVELDLQENPNQLSVDAADPNYILNNIQLTFPRIWRDFNLADMELVRMDNQRNTYAFNIDNSTIDGPGGAWTLSHRLYNDVDALLEIAEEDDLPFHQGMAKFFKAYTMVTMVDHLGQIVFLEANNPEEFPLPGLDPGEEVYDAAFALLQEAESHFNNQTVNIPNDLYYDGDSNNWIKAVNSLRLKMHITTRLVTPSESEAAINSIISQGNYIQNHEEDLTFKYSANVSPADSRHPKYAFNYGASFVGEYVSNDLLWKLKEEKFNVDPRLPYYIYRQTHQAPSGGNLPCTNDRERYNYCYVGDLYWGRDHKDTEGIPNDAQLRSTWGIYPIGGAFDPGPPSQGENRSVANNPGLNGAGILPLWLSSFSSFTLAESALVLGTTGDPATLLEEGIRKSFQKVENFSGIPMSQADKDAYVAEVLGNFTAADSEEEKLEIIITEYYLALYGNGVEAYNNYRRTGYPTFPPGVVIPNELFPRSFLYPEDEVATNPNIEQRERSDKVFWDTLPDSELN